MVVRGCVGVRRGRYVLFSCYFAHQLLLQVLPAPAMPVAGLPMLLPAR